MENLSEAQKRILKREEMKEKIKVTNYLTSVGFVATNDGYFVRIEKGSPVVIFFDWNKDYWIMDTADSTFENVTLEQIKPALNA